MFHRSSLDKIIFVATYFALIYSASFTTPSFISGCQYFATKIVATSHLYADIYIFCKYSQILQISKWSITNSLPGQEIFNEISLNYSISSPRINFYENMFSVQENNKIFLFYLENLTFYNMYDSPIIFDGIYSKRNQIFYMKNPNGNNNPVFYHDLQGQNPKNMNVLFSAPQATQHLLFWGQTKLITFFKGANYIQIRDTHQYNIPQNFSTFQTINLVHSDYQCFCLDKNENFLYILDSTGLLLKINLVNHLVISLNYLNLNGQHAMHFLRAQQIIFLKFVFNSNIKTGMYVSSFNQTSLSLTFNEFFYDQTDFIYSSKSQVILLQTLVYPFNVQLHSTNIDGCIRYGVYEQSFECKLCPTYCKNCTNSTICTSCLTGYTLNPNTSQCLGFPQCPSEKFFSLQTFACMNCSSNCLSCNESNSCLSCYYGYELNSGYCNLMNNTANFAFNNIIGQIGIHLNTTIQEIFNNPNTKFINKIPLSRQIFKFIMLFFPNIDDFWLYSYHERNYTPSFNSFLNFISMLESQKWNPLDLVEIQNLTKIDEQITKIQQKLDTTKAYSRAKFIEKEGKGETLLTNCLYLFTVNIVSSLGMLSCLKILFHLVSKYRISKVLRPFCFWGYSGVLLIDGNIQMIYFLMFILKMERLQKHENFLGKTSAQELAAYKGESLKVVDNRTGKNYEVTLKESNYSYFFNTKELARIEDENHQPLKFYDPGFKETISHSTKISNADGDKGKLEFRGYSIEQLAENSNLLEVAFLLIHGELPSSHQMAYFSKSVMQHSELPVEIQKLIKSFRYDAHPMGISIACISALSALKNEASQRQDSATNIDAQYKNRQIYRILGTIPSIAANSFRHRIGRQYVAPAKHLGYVQNFLYMKDYSNDIHYRPHPVLTRAIEVLFILHAEHETCCSTSFMRHMTSSGADVYTSTAMAAGALYGPRHGGANQATLRQMQELKCKENIPKLIQDVKDRKKNLYGFGHRCYKHHDPRTKIIKKIAEQVFEICGKSPLFQVALELEKTVLADQYFKSRKLFPNIDLYTGIIYSAMGFQAEMLPVLFLIPRALGWIAHWNEFLEDEQNDMYQPSVNYVGQRGRKFIEMSQRQQNKDHVEANIQKQDIIREATSKLRSKL